MTSEEVQDYIVVGGIVDFQMFMMPELCKERKGSWTIRKVYSVEERLAKQIKYPDATHSDAQPCEVKYTLPSTIFMSEDTSAIKVSIWDKEHKRWSDDDIHDEIKFSKVTKELSFSTSRFAPMAMLQSRCTDYPYKDWWLRCVSEDKAILTIWTKRLKMTFEITPLCLALTQTSLETPELAHIKNKSLTPGYLLAELSKCGIHMMPRDEDA